MKTRICSCLCNRRWTLPVILTVFLLLPAGAIHAAADAPFQWDSHLSITDDTRHYHQIGFSPDGSRFFGISDQTVYIWDSADGSEVAQFAHAQRTVNAALSADNGQLITLSESRSAHLWDVKSGTLLQTFGDGDHALGSDIEFVAWSPQGPRAVQAGSDWSLSFFDAMTAEPLLHLDQMTAKAVRLVFSAAGNRIVTAEENGNIRVFDAARSLMPSPASFCWPCRKTPCPVPGTEGPATRFRFSLPLTAGVS
ncbi:hypothetical protein ECTPHS_08678 [Ectothiorhodospira sp. PHS-1]|uniref:WD40 repeat domain-containing protein n=1 Tax=Ectothiorhodospira sp. PHS-1 TaxID=519989 RepID=UPI00024A8445|nr:hypothetical protein [Ectothiorhodospira sp. PHS-1]EHQ52752.1 hypothetical protein ECTPHS_08678 [Ectothiorhodospira sp. PHS-1]